MLLKRKQMMKTFAVVMYPFLMLMVIRFAPFPGGSLLDFFNYVSDEMEAPFQFSWSEHTIPALLIMTVLYITVFFLIITSMKNTRYGEEHGSARWMDAAKLGRKLKTAKRKIRDKMGVLNNLWYLHRYFDIL